MDDEFAPAVLDAAGCPVALEFLCNAPIDLATAAELAPQALSIAHDDATECLARAERLAIWAGDVLLPMALADLVVPANELVEVASDRGLPVDEREPCLEAAVRVGRAVQAINWSLHACLSAKEIVSAAQDWEAREDRRRRSTIRRRRSSSTS